MQSRETETHPSHNAAQPAPLPAPPHRGGHRPNPLSEEEPPKGNTPTPELRREAGTRQPPPRSLPSVGRPAQPATHGSTLLLRYSCPRSVGATTALPAQTGPHHSGTPGTLMSVFPLRKCIFTLYPQATGMIPGGEAPLQMGIGESYFGFFPL